MTYAVRLADISKDKPSLLSLWKRNLESIEEKRYEWIYANNVTGPPACHLLYHESTSAIVGAMTLFPRNIFIQGRCIPAFICGDLVVDRGHRSLGPAIKLIRSAVSHCEKDPPCLIFSYPNQLSYSVMKRAGFHELGDIHTMIRIIKTYPYIRRYIHFPLLERAISYPLDVLYSIWNLDFVRRQRIGCKIEESFSVDRRIDALWDKMKTSFTMVGERTSDYLRWRFCQSPHSDYTVFTLSKNEASDLNGCIVYSVSNNRARIEDVGFCGDDESFGILIEAFVRHQKSKGIGSVAFSITGSPEWVGLLKKNGFILRPSPHKTLVYTTLKQKAVLSESIQGRWLLTSADNDI